MKLPSPGKRVYPEQPPELPGVELLRAAQSWTQPSHDCAATLYPCAAVSSASIIPRPRLAATLPLILLQGCGVANSPHVAGNGRQPPQISSCDQAPEPRKHPVDIS